MNDFYELFELYPQIDRHSYKPLYYIEFSKPHGRKETWTLFKRNFIYSEEEWDKMEKDVLMKLVGPEGHSYNLFGDEVLPEHCVPNKTWIKWMVDQLNKQ